jgi:hypothetical protein
MHKRLELFHFVIKPLFSYELAVSPLFKDLALFDDDYLVNLFDRGEAMRDYNRGLAFCEFIKAGLDGGLVFGVKS